MPNWCYNKMTVYGDAEELRTFIKMVELPEKMGSEWREETHSLVRLMPMPSALEGTTSPVPDSPDPHPNWALMLANGEMTQEWYDQLVSNQVERYNEGQRVRAQTGYSSWYEWQHANWGIKWGDCNTTVDYEDGGDTALISYETPWAPFGDSFMEHVSVTFPNLTFGIVMTEEANFFAGADKWQNGVKHSIDVDIDGIIDSVPTVEDESSDEGLERWYEINERIMDAAESAGTALGF